MRLIGMLGGTSWPSTVLPYRMLNETVQHRLGPTHSARIALYSIDYAAIRRCYSADMGALPALLLEEIRTLLSFKPDCWMIANNTLHRFLPEIAPQLGAAPPLLHAIDLVRDDLLAKAARKVLLLGTRFTMEDGYYARPLQQAGIEVVIPGEADRERIGAILAQLANGIIQAEFGPYFAELIARHAAEGCETVVAGCTEIPLVVTQSMVPIPLVDPLRLQCTACADFALAT